MRFFRGLAVPAATAMVTVVEIREKGIFTNAWSWRTEHYRPDPRLLDKFDLCLADTRPEGASWPPAACACGDLEGASYYAWRHNRSDTNDTPVIIEFEADAEQVAIDGKDCLYTVFQMGDPMRAQKFIHAAFGEKGLKYAEKAWQTEEQRTRIAFCDLAIHDQEVVKAHHLNTLVIGGRYRTVFKSAFTVALPIPPKNIINAWIPHLLLELPAVDVSLRDLLPKANA